MTDPQYRGQFQILRESGDYDTNGRIMLRQDDQNSFYDSLNDKQSVSRLVDERINLVQESFPNYARIDHFAQDPLKLSQRSFNQQPIDQRSIRNLTGRQQNPVEDQAKAPEFHDQLRQMREEIVKEYEEKLKANLQEVQEYKVQLEQTMRDNDQKQIGLFQKQITDKERQLYQISAEKLEMENIVKHQEKSVQEKEEVIINYKQNYDQLKQENDRIQQKIQQYELKEDVINKYVEDLKRNDDDMKGKYKDMLQQMNELSKQDWSKQILELKRENQFLRDELAYKQKEVNDMKYNLSMAMQSASNNSNSNHFTNLLETQSKEIVRMKRQIEEFDKKEKQCTRKWNSLLQENLSLQEKVNSQKQQLLRQKEQYQGIISQIERKVIEANQRLAFVQQSEDKRAAAEYLVLQIKIASDEKQSLINENDTLHMKIQDLQDDYQKIVMECKDFIALKQGQGSFNHPDFHIQNQQKLLMKIEELEDLVMELKSQQSHNEIVELKQLLLVKEQETQIQTAKLEELRKQRLPLKNLFDNNEFYDQFQTIINERNQQIVNLKRELSQIKNSEFMNKMKLPQISGSGVSSQNQFFERPVQDIRQQSNQQLLANQFNPHGNSWMDEREKWIMLQQSQNRDPIGQWQ